MRVAILGGTGKLGSGLALRWARSEEVVLGSRQEERAARAAGELNRKLGEGRIRGASNRRAAEGAELAVLAVPYRSPSGSQADILTEVKEALAGKILISAVVPVDPGRPGRLLPLGRSAAEEAQEILGPSVRVAAAFQTVAYTHLHDLSRQPAGDVLACSDFEDAKAEAIRLAGLCGLRGLDAGPLQNARTVEGLTPILIHLNMRYKVKRAGFRVTGVEGV